MGDKKGDGYPQMASAPNCEPDANLFHRPPPPSYEESQRWNPQPMYAPQGGNFYPALSGNPPPYAGLHQPMHYAQQHPMVGFAPNQMQYGYNYNAQPQMMTGTGLQSQQNPNAMPGISAQTVTFDAGARFKGMGAGSISIPPPPPGCAPTPEQVAAMQGQPVILKKKKNSFF